MGLHPPLCSPSGAYLASTTRPSALHLGSAHSPGSGLPRPQLVDLLPRFLLSYQLYCLPVTVVKLRASSKSQIFQPTLQLLGGLSPLCDLSAKEKHGVPAFSPSELSFLLDTSSHGTLNDCTRPVPSFDPWSTPQVLGCCVGGGPAQSLKRCRVHTRTLRFRPVPGEEMEKETNNQCKYESRTQLLTCMLCCSADCTSEDTYEYPLPVQGR